MLCRPHQHQHQNQNQLTVNAKSVGVEFLSWRADTSLGRGVEDQSTGAVADTAPVAVDDEAPVGGARDAVAVLVEGVARRANAVLVLVQDEALARWARFH